MRTANELYDESSNRNDYQRRFRDVSKENGTMVTSEAKTDKKKKLADDDAES
jgi:hypothetical protein